MATGLALNLIATDKDEIRRDIRSQIVAKLNNKTYRDVFVSEQINTGLAFQIRALREQRDWSQAELASKAEMAQPRISVMEDANYARFNLNTLKRLASAFDCGLIVRFAPFSELVTNFENLAPHSLEAVQFNEDKFFQETEIRSTATSPAFQKIVVNSNAVPLPRIIVNTVGDPGRITNTQDMTFWSLTGIQGETTAQRQYV